MSVVDRRPSLDELLLTPIVIAWENHLWTNEMLAVATARTPLGKYGSMQHFSAEAYFDLGDDHVHALATNWARRQFDYGLRPWARFDRPAMPTLSIFGERVNRVLAWVDRRFR